MQLLFLLLPVGMQNSYVKSHEFLRNVTPANNTGCLYVKNSGNIYKYVHVNNMLETEKI